MKTVRILPKRLRLQLKLIQRNVQDLIRGYPARFAKPGEKLPPFPYSLSLQQSILPGPYQENKTANIRKACAALETVVLQPGEILSFWKIIGEPSQKKGYKIGRNIIAGQLQSDYGGGLCQVSGILYHLSLLSGLEILERHHHSVDIYVEEKRFTPLGADATVVYGYKDLRLRNCYPFSLQYRFEVTENALTACLLSPLPLSERTITFDRTDRVSGIDVTGRDEHGAPVNLSRYQKPTSLKL